MRDTSRDHHRADRRTAGMGSVFGVGCAGRGPVRLSGFDSRRRGWVMYSSSGPVWIGNIGCLLGYPSPHGGERGFLLSRPQPIRSLAQEKPTSDLIRPGDNQSKK